MLSLETRSKEKKGRRKQNEVTGNNWYKEWLQGPLGNGPSFVSLEMEVSVKSRILLLS